MNFSLKLKEEWIAGAPHAPCCRHAYLRGLFLDAGQTRSGRVVLSLSSAAAKEESARIYRECYKKEVLVGDGGRLFFASGELLEELTKPPVFVCAHCREHFLRGIFVARAGMTDPEKGYRFEIRLRDAENLSLLTETLAFFGWEPIIRTHRGEVSLYFKDSTVMEEILTLTGAHNALFALMNAKINRGIRNDENRATNCVTSNIGKSIRAAGEVLSAIEYIKSVGALGALSPELQKTALLRAEHPEATLPELAALHNPPITKSGLSHRLHKIIEIAGEWPEKEN